MADYQVYFRMDGGPWVGSAPGADPVTNTGGVDLSAMAGTVMYPTVQGTGDAGITVNFGASSFAHAPPTGYQAGWPGAAGFTTLDPAKAFGSGTPVSGNLRATFLTTPGVVQAVVGQTTGRHYFELVNPTADIFSAFWGGGIGQNFADGGDYNQWFGGKFTDSNDLGGALVTGQTLIHGFTSIVALGSVVAPDVWDFAANLGHVMGVAVFLTSAPPPPPPSTPSIRVPVGLGRWRGQCGINWNGLALVGDAFTNVVGLSNFDIFSEYGNQIRMLATSPPLHDDRKRLFIPRFEVEVEAGEGEPNSPQTAPQLILDYSKDGGKTFQPLQVFRSMGAAGDYVKRLRWINLGNARTWVFRIQYADAARPTVIGTYYDVHKALG